MFTEMERKIILGLLEERQDDVVKIIEELKVDGDEYDELEGWISYEDDLVYLMDRVRDGKELEDLWYEYIYVDMEYLVEDLDDNDDKKIVYKKYRG